MEVLNLKNKLECGITNYLSEQATVENLKKIDNENQEIINQYHQIINSAKGEIFYYNFYIFQLLIN